MLGERAHDAVGIGTAVGPDADDSVHLLHTTHIPDDVWNEVMKIRQDIVDGKLKVEPIFDAQQVRALMTSVAAK